MENNLFTPFFTEEETKSPEFEERGLPDEQKIPFLSSFLIELVHRIKKTLASIKSFTLLPIDKFDDLEFRKYFLKSITEDIKKMDSVLNTLLNYININSPLVKKNTLHHILEGVLETNEKQIQDKKIKIVKKFEKDIPESCIHDEQMKFIFDSILQYAILSSPINGTIGILIKSINFQKEMSSKKTSLESDGGSIIIVIGFIGNKTPGEEMGLVLKLVKEIIQKNRGVMTFKVSEKRPRTLITLRLPIERRKVIFYEPITL